MVEQSPVVERVLTVTAHPDDVDFGYAGTVASLVSDGVEVTYCVVTDGEAGGFDASVSRSQMARTRREEQRAAAAAVGVHDVVFLGYPDGQVEPTLNLRRDITRVIRSVRPDRVLTQSPNRNLDRMFSSHPDHLACGEATLSAVYPDARNGFAFPELLAEGLEPHTAWQVWVGDPGGTRAVVDITDHIDKKINALMCHRSQVERWDEEEFSGRIRTWAADTAAECDLPEGRFAESFRVLDTA